MAASAMALPNGTTCRSDVGQESWCGLRELQEDEVLKRHRTSETYIDVGQESCVSMAAFRWRCVGVAHSGTEVDVTG